MACEATAYARAGLVGNPSDGYFGKTISFSVRNFAAKVSLYESPEVEIVPSRRDRSSYGSVRELAEDVNAYGYYGGIRLMKAAICRFVKYCDSHDIPLLERNFSVRYRSTIPRHVGMAGSSALVTATMHCLCEYYDVVIPLPQLANLVLSVEVEELGISAGLQDRVIQAYEGCVFMDFDQALMKKQGHGRYEPIDPALLPPLFVAYRTDLAEGSEVFHNNIRERWKRGDEQVMQAMKDFAAFAQKAYDLIVAGRGTDIAPLMDDNFNLRQSLYQISPANIDMINRARSVGASCKFTGSGGAVVGVYEDQAHLERIRTAYEGTSCVVIEPRIMGAPNGM